MSIPYAFTVWVWSALNIPHSIGKRYFYSDSIQTIFRK